MPRPQHVFGALLAVLLLCCVCSGQGGLLDEDKGFSGPTGGGVNTFAVVGGHALTGPTNRNTTGSGSGTASSPGTASGSGTGSGTPGSGTVPSTPGSGTGSGTTSGSGTGSGTASGSGTGSGTTSGSGTGSGTTSGSGTGSSTSLGSGSGGNGGTTNTASPTVPCRVRYCTQCAATSNTVCQTCYNGYTRNSAGLCALTCRVNNCNECVTGFSTSCRVCRSPYTRLSNGLCGMVQNRPPTTIVIMGAAAPTSLLVAVGAAVLSVVALFM